MCIATITGYFASACIPATSIADYQDRRLPAATAITALVSCHGNVHAAFLNAHH
jgi:hypothetical protein